MGVSNVDRLPKSILFNRLKTDYNFERLLRAEYRNATTKRKREEKSSPSATESKKKAVKLNTLDPIMLTVIPRNAKTFKFSRPNGTVVQFNVATLIDYLLATGDFTDPETRIPFSEKDLQDIDALGVELGLGKSSVLAAKRNVNGYSEAKFRRDALLALERCAGEVIADMLQIVENYDPDEAQMELAMTEFPVFLDYYRQMKTADPEYAAKCLAHWRLFIAGPPNKPNHDEYGLLRVVSLFLRSCGEINT
jgi:hypothetical protein